ncbi:unnamed protein product [Aureobasidium mustum]|uniref:Uncharacterized protein n=1 Tax=Aureobasidium mustum TaxID=2773714 RepID=A0A9N8KA36_9PEZI|nr:unnamed protein product [Aureobasidium mustum]
MTEYSTSSPIGAGTSDIPSTPNVPPTPSVPSSPSVSLTPDIPSTPVLPSFPSLKDEPITEDEEIFPPTPEGLSRRQYNLFKRNRKTALKTAQMMAQVIEEMDDAAEDVAAGPASPAGYKKGDFGRQARKLIKSTDKHGMLSPSTHKVVKPAIPATHNSSSNNRSNSSKGNRNSKDAISGADTVSDTEPTKNNKVPVKHNSTHGFLSTPVPKPEPVPEPPTSETVDDALGPKPEPIIPGPPTPGSSSPPAPVFWKVLWASLSAPTNPSV